MSQQTSSDARPRGHGEEPPAGPVEAYDTVIVATPDLAGRLVGKRVTARHFANSADARTCDVVFGWGVGHELLDGFETIGWEHGYGDIVSRPDPTTLRNLAWWPNTALVMADAQGEDGEPLAIAPRSILRRQVERLAELGMQALTATELEFTILAETQAEMRERGFATPRLALGDLHPELVETTGLQEDLLGEIRSAMEASGVLIESVKAEYSPSQWEIALDPSDPLEAADRHAIYKLGVRELCRRHGCTATFMAKWDTDHGGQSCHLHVSLADKSGENLFAGDEALLRRFVGGLQRYAGELLLLWAPYPNSYRRFREGTFAPSTLSWGTDNRTAAIRLTGSGGSRHLENRIPGADVNPYLALAGLLAAGIAGIEEELDPDAGVGHANAYADDGATAIPTSLDAAIDAFGESAMAARAFDPQVVAHLTNFAAKELEASRIAVTDWDRRRLLDI